MRRVLIAGLVGGFLLFLGGFVDHMFFGWTGRTLSRLPDEQAIQRFLELQQLQAGWYGYPQLKENYDQLSAEEQKAEFERVGALYKQGPAAYIIVPPPGEEMMSRWQLALEGLAGVASATVVAAILYIAGVGSFVTRWLLAIAIGLVAWIDISASHHIWYRFPWSFTRDELFCVLFEWFLAGFAIALIVRPRTQEEA